MSDIIERKPNGQFQKGVSGNPGGLKPIPDEVREAARAESLPSIQTLASIRDDKRQPAAARVSACIALLDRAWGKPAQTVIAEVTERFAFEIPAVLEEAEWIELNTPKLTAQ